MTSWVRIPSPAPFPCAGDLGTVRICKVCGHTIEGDAPDCCPICGAKAEVFVAFE
ncbi:MAG: hypothetical protein U9R68_09995 [Planctomycetota bacterium]|nr:hypothetical protein [Planctomycetota bacterium]